VKHRYLYFFLWSFIIALSCKPGKRAADTEATGEAAEQKENFEAGNLYRAVTGSASAAQSYALYLPHQPAQGAMLFFDPHGDGSYPVSKYISLADQYGFILIGSNNSRNGISFEETNRIVDELINETASRFKIGNGLISLAGFSGGARVALTAASIHPELNAVIYCGAGMEPAALKTLPPALGIAGKSDLNYTEVIALDNALEKKGSPHCLVQWNGKHEWPDSVIFKNAMQWSLFNAMKKNLVQRNDEAVQKFIMENLKTSSDVLEEELRQRKMIAFVKGLADVSSVEQKRNAILSSPEYLKAVAAQRESFEIENRMKQNYIECIQTKDIGWWRDEIARLQKIKSGSEHNMYQRLLGYISLACYSFSNAAINQGRREEAQKILAVYKLADPENPDIANLEAALSKLP
jgi:predicted esterase